MFHRRVGSVLNLRLDNCLLKWPTDEFKTLEALPRKLKRAEKKPWVTNINELKRRGRLDKQERRMVREVALRPPENGLLVKELIPVAHQVLAPRGHILACVSRISEEILIYFCSFCSEVHVGHPPHKIRTCNVSGKHVLPVVESFHLYDRLGRAVSHDERLEVDRIPALVELCIQAGFPGKLIDFEKKFPKDDLSGKDVETSKSREIIKKLSGDGKYLNLPYDDIKGFDMRGLVRQCQAFKHQMRDGQHGWQESTIDDFLSTVYVWHGRNSHDGELLVDSLKRYHGKLPAVVELFSQAGAQVGDDYYRMMREEVAVPGLDEEKLVV
ncbi:hypothetical protein K7X08_015626 [Anisodus acutangulus]|uniref:APO domain-containing protein n=1 Tax=Anisodus acutangulus TaxID=402998 RepID=A0A9Q1LBT1_9SOLA|nr:hypothetical protein K7X08_015626 [Anisodus acutangulus]